MFCKEGEKAGSGGEDLGGKEGGGTMIKIHYMQKQYLREKKSER